MARSTPEVGALMKALDHPHKAAIDALRTLILAANKHIREHVKWNAPSFALADHFATFHLRAKEGIQIVLHLGAKPRATKLKGKIVDPAKLLTWKDHNRAIVTLRDAADVKARGKALQDVIRAWIEFVPRSS